VPVRVKESHPALKLGDYSTTTILPGESFAAFETLHRDLISELAPNSALADDIVATIARLTWRKRNLATFRTAPNVRFKYQMVMRREFSRLQPAQALPPELGKLPFHELLLNDAKLWEEIHAGEAAARRSSETTPTRWRRSAK
jgi:hypothetical protein